MIREEFLRLAAAGYNRIPLARETLADFDTPLSIYLKLADQPNSYLLESVQGGEKWGRYSIIGLPCRTVLRVLAGMLGLLILWALIGKLDIVAVAEGKLVPQSYLKIVQPAEAGIVKEILVREGETVKTGQVLMRMDTLITDADAH